MSKRNADTKRNVWQGKNIAFNVKALAMLGNRELFAGTKDSKRTKNQYYVQKTILEFSAGTADEQRTKADCLHFCPSIANAM